MKLSEWARQQGLSYKTAWTLFKRNQLPVPAIQLPTGTIILQEKTAHSESNPEVLVAKTAIYARVSSHDQKDDLARQVERLRSFCAGKALKIDKEVTEIASGLNAKRNKLLNLLKDHDYKTIVVEHRDRLARFGFEIVEAALAASGRELVIMNETENKNDLVQDFIDVATSLCARIYGQRAAKNKAVRALEATKE